MKMSTLKKIVLALVLVMVVVGVVWEGIDLLQPTPPPPHVFLNVQQGVCIATLLPDEKTIPLRKMGGSWWGEAEDEQISYEPHIERRFAYVYGVNYDNGGGPVKLPITGSCPG